MEPRPFSGALTALVTPFQPDLQLDLLSLEKVLKIQKAAGMNGVVIAGTTGESPTLSREEKMRVLEVALKEQDDSFSVFVGTGTNSTASTIEESVAFAQFRSQGKGVRGVMTVAPYYNKPNQAGIFAHFSSVAQAIPQTPVCLYNVPGRTACSVAAHTFAELVSAQQNIVAIKEASGDVSAMTALVLALKDLGVTRHIDILCGDDVTFAPSLITGASGIISVISHVVPDAIVAMLKAAEASDLEKLRMLHTRTFPLAQALFCAPNPAPVKYALSLTNSCEPHVRSPLVPLSEEEKNLVKKCLAGFI